VSLAGGGGKSALEIIDVKTRKRRVLDGFEVRDPAWR
jgi:hypothetical protein